MVLAGILAAGVWVLAVLLVAIMQLPPIFVLGPIAAYYISVADTTPVLLFLIWSIVVSANDAVLKPMFFGRGEVAFPKCTSALICVVKVPDM